MKAEGCAGQEISEAMTMLSRVLLDGSKYFAELASTGKESNHISYANISCILMGATSLEAKINEWVSVQERLIKAAEKNGDADKLPYTTEQIKTFYSLQRTTSISEKWNQSIALGSAGRTDIWDEGREPFQSFNLIYHLRNEITHYKGDFLGKNEMPTKKLKELMRNLGIKSRASFMDDDASTWISDLLDCNGLGKWVYEKVNSMHDEYLGTPSKS